MKLNTKILIISLVCLILGGLIGFFTAGRIVKKRIHNMVEYQRPPLFKEHLEHKLNLNDEQQLMFDRMFHDHMMRMKSIDQGTRAKRAEEFRKLFNELETALDESQKKDLEKFRLRLEARHKRRNFQPPPPPGE